MSQKTEPTKQYNMPLISVIVPVYNGEKTIRETIESVLAQSFSDFELIVINDGSQDSTLDVLAASKTLD
jgi:glycosyltransferase involved in cell wall biosynthesis